MLRYDRFAKTGSGKTQEKSRKKRCVFCCRFSAAIRRLTADWADWCEKMPLFAPFTDENASFYQARLGTNIGK
jgi:hypothetical protein